MKKVFYILPFMALLFTSCLDDDNETYQDYATWRTLNDEYVSKMENLTENGEKVYTKVSQGWAPKDFVLIKWHNDRSLTEKNLVPLNNSTVNIKYEMEDVEGKDLENSYSMTTNGDSIYQCKPINTIMGMQLALTTLHEGDSVTLVIPSESAYGMQSIDPIKPFSALIYHMKLTKVVKYDK